MVSGEHGSSDQMMVRQLWEELPDPQDPAQAQPRRGRGRGGGQGGGRQGDMRVKLERSRQSARECRARKKLRYQYLDDMIAGEDHYIVNLVAFLDTALRNNKPRTTMILICDNLSSNPDQK